MTEPKKETPKAAPAPTPKVEPKVVPQTVADGAQNVGVVPPSCVGTCQDPNRN